MEKRTVSKILLVGGGLTASLTANLIKREATVDITLWEKEKTLGGRMTTFYHPSNPLSSVDLGLQYVTANLDFIRNHAQFYYELFEENLLITLENKIKDFKAFSECKTNFVIPAGSVSLTKHFLYQADTNVCLNSEVTEININEQSKQWEVKSSSGITQYFDAVILTLPAPQVLKLKGSFQDLLAKQEHIKIAMEQVRYSCCYAVSFFYNKRIQVLQDCSWIDKYFPNDDIVYFVAIDNRKRGKPEEFPAVLIHTTARFGELHMEHKEDEVQQIVLERLKCLLPDIPHPDYIKSIKWPYSQVIDSYLDNPGCIFLSNDPCLICGGDSFTESSFDGCLTSALTIVEELLKCGTISRAYKCRQEREP